MERLVKVAEVKAKNASQITKSKIGLGFEKLDRDAFDPLKAYDPVFEVGAKWIRIQSGWAKTEEVAGVYDFAWLDDIVDNLLKRSLTPWICLCYGNKIYSEAATQVYGAVGVLPINTEAERVAWANYVTAVTKHYKGRVSLFEVWNEPDGIWCWKHGVNATEYGNFIIATAAAARKGNPDVEMVGGVNCTGNLQWVDEVLATGAASVIDYWSYHSYSAFEQNTNYRTKAIRAICKSYNPKIELIQGETGTQSRSDGAGALRGGAWTQRKQAKFLIRHMINDFMLEVKFASFFSCLDMVEALNGNVNDKNSFLDYGYFGILSAEFDEDGKATGVYTPKISYKALQSITSIFEGDYTVAELPVHIIGDEFSIRIQQTEEPSSSTVIGGFRKPNGSAAIAYWKPSSILTTDYESTVTFQTACLKGKIQLVDLLDGNIYDIPESIVEDLGNNCYKFKYLPIKDYPMLLTFGDFI